VTCLRDLARMISILVSDDELVLFLDAGEPFAAREPLPAERLIETFDAKVATGRALLASAA
jgi:hypothetical protein